MTAEIFLSIGTAGAALRIFQYGWLYAPFVFKLPLKSGENAVQPVSLLISARNEEGNLRQNLDSWLSQDHPDYEVIVVDDQSEDDSLYFLKEKARQYQHLHVIELGQHLYRYPGKKLSLMLAMKRASNDCLIFTDADCYPASNSCLREMSKGFDNQKQIVLGYAPTLSANQGHQQGFFSWETMMTGMQFHALALKGKPYMGVGRNMGYRKSFFLDRKGFSGQLNMAQGDDDLFVARNADADNTAQVVTPEAYVFSPNKKSWTEWLKQKKRHLSTGGKYPSSIRMMLGLNWLTGFWFYAALIFILFSEQYWMYGGGAWLVALVLQAVVQFKAYSQMNGKAGYGFALHWLYDLFYHIFYYPFMGLVLSFSRGRKAGGKFS